LVAAVALWMASQGVDPVEGLAVLLPGLYVDGWLVGAASARAMVDGAPLDLGDWTPGDTAVAQAQIEALGVSAGLATLLDGVPDAARDIADGRLKDLARVLIDGTDAGDPADVVGDALLEEAGDPARAAAVATGAVVTAAGLAAMAAYLGAGVRMGRWVTDSGNVCPACRANADAGEVPVGEPYPSGAVEAPQHPRCRCQVVPA